MSQRPDARAGPLGSRAAGKEPWRAELTLDRGDKTQDSCWPPQPRSSAGRPVDRDPWLNPWPSCQALLFSGRPNLVSFLVSRPAFLAASAAQGMTCVSGGLPAGQSPGLRVEQRSVWGQNPESEVREEPRVGPGADLHLPCWERLRKEAGGLPPHPHSYLWRMLSHHHVITPSV